MKKPFKMGGRCSWPRAIIHLDMDAFYPSVEILDNPSLQGKPVIVGGTTNRGVVSSASYEARKFGVHSAQPIVSARRLCPHGIYLPVRMERYREISNRIFALFRTVTPLVEPISIDEAFLDVIGSSRLFGPPRAIAVKVKRMVREETGLTVSAGLAPSKFVAKIASDIDKPNGLTVVRPGQVQSFLAPLPIQKMWGVGKKTQRRLYDLGIRTIGDVVRLPSASLEKRFGKQGRKMYELALGIDPREVIPVHAAKSIGNEITFPRDIQDADVARKELLFLANKVAKRLRREGVTGKTVTLKVKYHDFQQITRSATLMHPTDDSHRLYGMACRLMEKTQLGRCPIRLLGLSVSQFIYSPAKGQLSLFSHSEVPVKRNDLNKALDSLSDRFGEGAVKPATLLSK